MSDIDHGLINLPLHKRGHGSIDAQIDRGLREIAKANAAKEREHKAARKAAKEAEANRVRLELPDVLGAKVVRDEFGWHHVLKVNAKSVTISTPYSWTERIPFHKIREVRR